MADNKIITGVIVILCISNYYCVCAVAESTAINNSGNKTLKEEKSEEPEQKLETYENNADFNAFIDKKIDEFNSFFTEERNDLMNKLAANPNNRYNSLLRHYLEELPNKLTRTEVYIWIKEKRTKILCSYFLCYKKIL